MKVSNLPTSNQVPADFCNSKLLKLFNGSYDLNTSCTLWTTSDAYSLALSIMFGSVECANGYCVFIFYMLLFLFFKC